MSIHSAYETAKHILHAAFHPHAHSSATKASAARTQQCASHAPREHRHMSQGVLVAGHLPSRDR